MWARMHLEKEGGVLVNMYVNGIELNESKYAGCSIYITIADELFAK